MGGGFAMTDGKSKDYNSIGGAKLAVDDGSQA